MPRGIGASVGVNDTVTGPGPGRGEVLLDLRGVPVDAADAVRRHRAHHLGAEQVRLERPPGARRAGCRDDGDVVGLEHAGGQARGEGQGDGGGVAARHGDAGGAGEGGALRAGGRGQLGHAVGPRPGVRGVVEGGPGVGVGEPEVGAAVDDDDVVRRAGRRARRCGRAAGRGRRRRGRRARRASCPRAPGRPAASGAGGREPSGCPAFEEAVSAPTSSSGCWRRRRTTSPPAYPLAPATATRFMCMTIQSRVTLCTRGSGPCRPNFPAPCENLQHRTGHGSGAQVKVPGSGGKVAATGRGQARGSSSPRASTRVRSSSPRPGRGPRPQRGDRVEPGPHEAPRPGVELARDEGEHELGHVGRVGPLGAAQRARPSPRSCRCARRPA